MGNSRRNATISALTNTGKKLTLNSNFEAFKKRLNTLNNNAQRNVLTEIKVNHTRSKNKNKRQGAIWKKITEVLNRKTRRNNMNMRRTRKSRR